MTPVSHEIYFTLPCSRFHSSIRNRLYIIHLILESILTRSLVDLMDLMDLLSHRYHGLHDTSYEIYSISATYRVLDFYSSIVLDCISFTEFS